MKRGARTKQLKPYRCKTHSLSGNRYSIVKPEARRIFRQLQKKTKRHPYVRSFYFNKDKIFFDYFWNHLHQGNPADQTRRLKYLPCALELLRHTRHDPMTFEEENRPCLLLHRFAGRTSNGKGFFVQVKENKRTNKKQCISIFPANK